MASSTESDPLLEYSPKAQEIIRCANQFLAIGGYNGFSYADIAESVGVRKASIHHHFPTKEVLVKVTVSLHRKVMKRGLQSLDSLVADPFERLLAYARYWAECIEKSNPPICIAALLASELPAVPHEVADEVRAHFNDLQSWVTAVMTEGQAAGAMTLLDSPSTDAAAFVASTHGAMLAARVAGDPSLFWAIASQAANRLRAP